MATKGSRTPERETSINHVGLVVDDVDEMKQKMAAAGYEGFMAERTGGRSNLII